MKTQALGPFLGLNNRLPDFALHVDKVGDYLRSADNADIDNKGNLTERSAVGKILALPGAHSICINNPGAGTGYVAVGAVLYPFPLPDPLLPFKVLSSSAPIHWCQEGADLFYSNGTDSGRITGGVDYPLGLATPAAPSCSAHGGALLDGSYQVSLSYSNATTGEESGLSAARAFSVAGVGGIRVALPAAVPGATHVNVYASAANGKVLRLAASIAVDTDTAYDLIALPTGRKGVIQFIAPLPAGELFMSNGRLCSIVNNGDSGTIYVGEPWKYGYYRPVAGRLHFRAPVTVAIENEGGTYICADKTFFYPGDLGAIKDRVRDCLPYGAAKGSAFRVPDAPRVGWLGAHGLVIADADGAAACITEATIDIGTPDSGPATVLTSKGITRAIAGGWCVNLDTKAVTRYLDWAFSSISHGYATRADGVYRLEADGPVDTTIDFGRLAFGSESLKRLPAVYAGMASARPLQLTVSYVDRKNEDREYAYLSRGCGERLKMQRFDPGLGLCANWFDVAIRNTEGAAFTLASISFAVKESHRSI